MITLSEIFHCYGPAYREQFGERMLPSQLAAMAASDGSARVVICPNCGEPMRLERVLLPHNRGPPSVPSKS
jgi:hypothetical protein